MNTRRLSISELTEELRQCSSVELNLIIATLLKEGSISYTDISQRYVEWLQSREHQWSSELTEGSTCIAQALMTSDIKDKDVTDRCIRLLDQSGVYLTEGLKKKFGYDEENGKKLSHYNTEL